MNIWNTCVHLRSSENKNTIYCACLKYFWKYLWLTISKTTSCIFPWAKQSMHSFLYITHQVTSRRKFYFKPWEHKNNSIFPLKNGEYFPHSGNSNNQAFTVFHIQKKKIVQNNHRRMQPEGVKKKPQHQKKPTHNKTNKTQKNKGERKQHHHIRIFMQRELPPQTS